MNIAPADVDLVRDYVDRLSRALRFLPADDRKAIVAEIESHISDCTSAGGKSVAETLDHLGDPEELAKAYIEQYRLEGALRSAYGSLLLTILERATRSVLALGIGFGAILLYGFSLGFAAMAVLKPVWPEHVGLWVGTGAGFNFGILDKAPAGAHELLGYWIIPVSVLSCIITYLAGRMLLRFGGRMLLRKRPLPASA